ncbi:MAG: hypothetical protein WA208_15695 [Thermoanaerobaculia bacterium]
MTATVGGGRSVRVGETFVEITVYAGIAERTGARVDRDVVRRSAGCCRSVSELLRKARSLGDGTFYLPLELWPKDQQQLETRKPWIVVSSLVPDARPK